MALDMRVNLEPKQADEIVNREIIDGSVTGELIDSHIVYGENGKLCIISVYEKHYYRAGNRLTLTVIIDNMEGATRVHSISGGGGEGLFRFDWGASKSFETCVENALAEYRI
ncbi:hypothetical protein KQI42_16200 [Tissierella sp. MSJ-40]|uniref:Uncharacterized protein n=1 Tax=Tissierella simiarum TaxID=2841534 RepID=A0ABS6E9V0_9FIRM|nr:DUF6054 family protein [Tissierella simiarum]MBU5439557.1 hypothetical protein [Tissierella simiarum]